MNTIETKGQSREEQIARLVGPLPVGLDGLAAKHQITCLHQAWIPKLEARNLQASQLELWSCDLLH